MICPKCKAENKKSCVYEEYISHTDLLYAPFYDEEDKYHVHDKNIIVVYYECTNGHQWSETGQRKCPSCNWQENNTLYA